MSSDKRHTLFDGRLRARDGFPVVAGGEGNARALVDVAQDTPQGLFRLFVDLAASQQRDNPAATSLVLDENGLPPVPVRSEDLGKSRLYSWMFKMIEAKAVWDGVSSARRVLGLPPLTLSPQRARLYEMSRLMVDLYQGKGDAAGVRFDMDNPLERRLAEIIGSPVFQTEMARVSQSREQERQELERRLQDFVAAQSNTAYGIKDVQVDGYVRTVYVQVLDWVETIVEHRRSEDHCHEDHCQRHCTFNTEGPDDYSMPLPPRQEAVTRTVHHYRDQPQHEYVPPHKKRFAAMMRVSAEDLAQQRQDLFEAVSERLMQRGLSTDLWLRGQTAAALDRGRLLPAP